MSAGLRLAPEPVVMGPANRCEITGCTAQAVMVVSNALACSSRRVCREHAGDVLLGEVEEVGEPARLTVLRLA